MVKRGVWIVACLIGVLVAGGLAILIGYTVFAEAQAGGPVHGRSVAWAVGLLLFAGACGAGLFMTPREMDSLTKPDEDPEPAKWVSELRREADTTAKSDRSDAP